MNEYERLLTLVADKLDVVSTTMPEHRFNFSNWVGKDWLGKEDLSCGTSACAIGFATTIPELRDLGLRLFKTETQWNHEIGILHPDGTSSKGANHVAMLFGLDDEEFNYLFIPSDQQGEEEVEENDVRYGSRTPGPRASAREVAAHIRNFIQYRYH